MFIHIIVAVILALLPLALGGNARAAARAQFTVQTSSGEILVERFASSAGGSHPAVLVLSGSKGFDSSAYDEIGRIFGAAVSIPILCMCFPGVIWRPSPAPEAPALASATMRNGKRTGSQLFTV